MVASCRETSSNWLKPWSLRVSTSLRSRVLCFWGIFLALCFSPVLFISRGSRKSRSLGRPPASADPEGEGRCLCLSIPEGQPQKRTQPRTRPRGREGEHTNYVLRSHAPRLRLWVEALPSPEPRRLCKVGGCRETDPGVYCGWLGSWMMQQSGLWQGQGLGPLHLGIRRSRAD